MNVRDRIEGRRLAVALGGGFGVNDPRFHQAFCEVLAQDIRDRPQDVVPYEETISRIRERLVETKRGREAERQT